MSAELESILPKMESTHAKFKAFIAGLDSTVVQQPSVGNPWNPREIVGHLVDAERAHRRFIEAVASGNPPAKVENFDGGNYRFWATVDDGVRIWVDDQLIIDYWRIGPATTVQCDHYLSPGPHTIKVEYFQAEGVAVIYVKYARL